MPESLPAMLQELGPRVTTSSPPASPFCNWVCSSEVIRSHPSAGSALYDTKPLAALPLPRMHTAGGQRVRLPDESADASTICD